MQLIKKVIKICDAVNEWIGNYLVCAIVFVFVAIIFSNVILRYVFNTSFVFMAELEWHLFAMIFLLGAGYTLLHDRHVRVDIFYSTMNRKKKALVNCIGVLFLLVPSCYLVLTTAVPWVISAYQIGEVSIDPGGIPARFAIKAMLPLGYGLILLQGISLLLKNILILTEKPANEPR
ncbi:TRAP transporter small permease subunit [Desulfopila sp. IMCC35008]|uniref:TRAP transporter small permease subunit n=1 Tax=Desulfopila sp. IMCC35008 TaxID=2653858 RepID=UPI0013CF8E98|nr:TRAP transporter small permease subunit [Desulfopila sp. IMCC35008]